MHHISILLNELSTMNYSNAKKENDTIFNFPRFSHTITDTINSCSGVACPSLAKYYQVDPADPEDEVFESFQFRWEIAMESICGWSE